ncbi:hypothetical protein BpHYR1_025668 [Brachionus plicatilis]|uniref:Uncharacterized protein n=1 Tax=Brachionus plicatilis TaxID=10195 RepID=A0A3M7P2M9_BRAPC|nr:hypothetical protein BpHYR1_025668 [Brachionus plicatilis]
MTTFSTGSSTLNISSSKKSEDFAVNQDANLKPATLGTISRNENAMNTIPSNQASQTVQVMDNQNEICQPAKKKEEDQKRINIFFNMFYFLHNGYKKRRLIKRLDSLGEFFNKTILGYFYHTLWPSERQNEIYKRIKIGGLNAE